MAALLNAGTDARQQRKENFRGWFLLASGMKKF
jgi:hypothetical protein